MEILQNLADFKKKNENKIKLIYCLIIVIYVDEMYSFQVNRTNGRKRLHHSPLLYLYELEE